MFTPRMAITAATTSPLAAANSEARSALSSVFASSTSFLARSVTLPVISPSSSRRAVAHGCLLFWRLHVWIARRPRLEELRVSTKRAVELQGLPVHDLPLVVADGQRANLLGNLVQAGVQNHRAGVRRGILAEGRPHPANLALDVLGRRIEGLVGGSVGERLHEQAMRPRRLLRGAPK